jgi:hypothetical protein
VQNEPQDSVVGCRFPSAKADGNEIWLPFIAVRFSERTDMRPFPRRDALRGRMQLKTI